MAGTIVHVSAHLQPTDTPQVGDAPSSMYPGTTTVWVSIGPAVNVYPDSPEQAESIALAFTEAAERLRGTAI